MRWKGSEKAVHAAVQAFLRSTDPEQREKLESLQSGEFRVNGDRWLRSRLTIPGGLMPYGDLPALTRGRDEPNEIIGILTRTGQELSVGIDVPYSDRGWLFVMLSRLFLFIEETADYESDPGN